MKNKYFLIILPLVIIFSFNGKKYDEAVIERLSVLVRVCLEGEDCGVSSQASGMTSSMSIVPINETKKVLMKKDKSIKGFNIGSNCGEVAGQTINHCHIHLTQSLSHN